MPSAKTPTTKQLLRDLKDAERAVDKARDAIIKEIRRRMGDVTPYQFAAASGINRGNLYNLVSNGRWNYNVALAALDFLSTPISDLEVARVRNRSNGGE